MAQSDLAQLLDMGFEKEKAEMAVKQSGGLQGAIDWLDKNQDKSIDDLTAEAAARDDDTDMPQLRPGEEARSLVCNECGKKFRSQAQAEFHASKTEHVDFSESTEEIAPLTEEEKKAKLEELRQRLAEKRVGTSEQDKLDRKRNEEIRRKSTKEQQDAKEALEKKERLKEAQAKKREKQDEIDAKKRIKAKIEADKAERRAKADKEKAERQGQTLATEPIIQSMPANAPVPKPKTNHTEARLRLQTPNGTLQKTFPAETTLFEVAHAVLEENGHEVQSFSLTFPRKAFETSDFGMTLKEAGMVPSAALIVK